MSPTLTTATILIVAGILFFALAVWLLMRANRTTKVVRDENAGKDVLDEGAARASRNQALIDAPSAVAQNFGSTSANANSDAIAAAGADADAEAGVKVAPSVGEPAPPPPAQTPSAQKPSPAPAPATEPGDADDLTRIKGLGPKLAALLAEQGITRFAQIAGWSDADVARVDEGLGRFKGRITRDQWVEQARLLAAGDDAGFSTRFGQNQ